MFLVPRTRAERRRTHSLVDVALDDKQREAVSLPARRALLVLGEAGHGKTTVLLHRLARVWSHDLRAAVLVPTEALVRLLQPLLRHLGVDVEVLTYDRWAAAQARRAFRRLPRESELTPPSVTRIKRDPALRLALAELAKREPGRLNDDADAAVLPTRQHVTRGDLQHLFGDRALLEQTFGSRRAVDDVLDRTRVQTGLTTEEAWAHVEDRQRLIAVDGRALDDGTATSHANTLDVEDYAVLFELDRMRAERRGKTPTAPRAFDLIAIDEAQEFAPLELALIGRSLTPDGTLIVAGDEQQQTGETSEFGGWEGVMRDLGRPDHATIRLDISYRCPPSVVTLAHAILDPLAPHSTGEPALMPLADLGRELALLARRDPRASVVVICRSPLTARAVVTRLRADVPARLVFDGRFLSRQPVQVTTVDEVKGLEFDYVIIPDATARDYPDNPASRRAMYVAVTRARHQALIAHPVGDRSDILPKT